MSEFPLLVFTVLTGLASGGYAMSVIFSLLQKRRHRSWVFSLICLAVLGVGMFGALAHLGHPERFLNALANPSAMIAQEAYWSIPFGCVLLVDALLLKIKNSSSRILPTLGSVLGIGLMVVTSIAYFTSYGIPGWPEVPTLFLFIVGDLALGASFALAFLKIASGRSDGSSSGSDSFKVVSNVAVFLYLALTVVFIAESIVFAGLSVDPWGFAASAVLAAVACALQAGETFGKTKGASFRWICFSLVALAVIVSRFAFYAMA